MRVHGQSNRAPTSVLDTSGAEWPINRTRTYRAVLEHEAEVDVHQVPLSIEQDIPVVAVFDVQQIAHDRVRGLCLAQQRTTEDAISE